MCPPIMAIPRRGLMKIKVPATRTIPTSVFRDIPAIRSGLTMLRWNRGINMLRTDISTDLLWDSDAEKAAAALSNAAANLQAIERELSAAEDLVWQPHWSKSDPLAERLRRVGVTDATANTLMSLIQGWDAFCRG